MCPINIKLGSVTEVLAFIAAATTLISLVVFGIWQIRLYQQLQANERAIRAKEDEIDAVDPDVTARTTGHNVTEGQRLAQIEHRRKPMYRELERLKQERQFLLNKLPFAKK